MDCECFVFARRTSLTSRLNQPMSRNNYAEQGARPKVLHPTPSHKSHAPAVPAGVSGLNTGSGSASKLTQQSVRFDPRLVDINEVKVRVEPSSTNLSGSDRKKNDVTSHASQDATGPEPSCLSFSLVGTCFYLLFLG